LIFKSILTAPIFYDLVHILPRLPKFETDSIIYKYQGEQKIIWTFLELLAYSLIGTEVISMYYNDSEMITKGLQIALIVSFSDACQYVIGKKYGSTHFGWPSPNKTYEGYFGGVIAIIVGSFCFGWLYSSIIIISGIIGDLFESRCKRILKLDETSNLLKEHGGWLDRVDSIYLAMIVMYPIIKYC
jgi:CDP-diglyceride synthetase